MFGSLRNANFKNDYTIEIITGNQGFWDSSEKIDHFNNEGHTYYSLHHGDEYKVKITNNTNDRVNALLKIDGVVMGKWRVGPYSDVIIERPADNQRKFTFVKENSWEAEQGSVIRGSDTNGLVEVTFIPELKTTVYADGKENFFESRGLFSAPSSNCFSNNWTNKSYSAGATVLGEGSAQTFGSASSIYEDQNRKVTRRVRLVVKNNSFTSIRSRDDPIPPKFPVKNDHYHWF